MKSIIFIFFVVELYSDSFSFSNNILMNNSWLIFVKIMNVIYAHNLLMNTIMVFPHIQKSSNFYIMKLRISIIIIIK